MSVPLRKHETVAYNHGEIQAFNESKVLFKNVSDTVESSEYENVYDNHVKKEVVNEEYNHINGSIKKEYQSGTLESSEYGNQCGNHVKKEVQDEDYKKLHDNVITEGFQNQLEILKSSNFEHRFDIKVKKEIPDEEYNQSYNSMKTDESLDFTNTTSERYISPEKEKCINIKKEGDHCPVSVFIEISGKQEVLYDSGDTGTHYDALVAPPKVTCKVCYRLFDNSFNLYKHNIKHLQIKIETLGNNQLNALLLRKGCSDVSKRQCDLCKKVFTTQISLNQHIRRVHHDYGRTFDCVCGKQFRTPYALHDHRYKCHSCNTETALRRYECPTCKKSFRIKRYLTQHIKRNHHDYGRSFDCVCGKQFTSPYALSNHRYSCHICSTEIACAAAYECDSCKKTFSIKRYLTEHMRRNHYDYGRLFDCECGKQFSSPYALTNHRHSCYSRITETTRGKYECDLCKKTFRVKRYLTEHMRRNHYDYGKLFDCVCGKQFTSPYALSYHRNTSSGCSMKTTIGEYECNLCQKIFKNKRYLTAHTKRVHCDYGSTFDCVCGKQFTSPYALNDHRYKYHSRSTGTTFDKYECDTCKKIYSNKPSLSAHIRRIHHDYGRTFDCVCGKQFSSPYGLNDHKFTSYGCSTKTTLVEYECGSCKKIFKIKRNLTAHIRRVHLDYGRTFNCVCGKQFTSPYALNDHKYQYHGRGTETAIGKFECDSCKKIYSNKRSLKVHIRRLH